MKKFKGVQESFALPSCSDMIDPFYERGDDRFWPRGIIFIKRTNDDAMKKYKTVRAEVEKMQEHLISSTEMFMVVRNLHDYVYADIKDNSK